MRVRDQETFRKRFGRNLRAARKALSLSQRQLAERAGIAEKYLSRVELAEVSPSIAVAFRLARAVGVGLDPLTGAEAGNTDARLTALILAFSARGGVDLERAVRVLQALADEP